MQRGSKATMAKIKEIRCIRTRSNGSWVIVKVITDQPGLYGIGSASDHYHAQTVITAIEEGLGPRLIGREAGHIEGAPPRSGGPAGIVHERLLAERLDPGHRPG